MRVDGGNNFSMGSGEGMQGKVFRAFLFLLNSPMHARACTLVKQIWSWPFFGGAFASWCCQKKKGSWSKI
jgi:hypothetical protein